MQDFNLSEIHSNGFDDVDASFSILDHIDNKGRKPSEGQREEEKM